MDAATWRYLKREIDRRKREQIRIARRGYKCAGCGGKYDRVTQGCLDCARRKRDRQRKRVQYALRQGTPAE